MIDKGGSIVVGLSGGADSCALLHFLVSLRDEYGLDIYACHVNHGIRGKEAERDEHFAEEFCKTLGVKLFTLHADVTGEAKKRGIGTELCGREIRYAFFEETAKKYGAKIATAHTASDNAETILLKLTRGSGINGLCGIPPVRDNIIRPLIESSRDDIENYCSRYGISYVTDSTNLTREYTRNKLRLDVVPVLKEINPSLENSLTAFSDRMREAYSYIRKNALELLSKAKCEGGYSAEALVSADEALFSEAVRIIFEEFDIIPEARHIELIRKIVYNGGAVEIRRNVFAISDGKILKAVFRAKEKPKKNTDVFVFENGRTVCIADKKITPLVMDADEFNKRKKINKNLFYNSLDYDTISLTGVFRTRRSGDVFSLPKRNVTKTVKKLFTEMKVPEEKRDSIVMLADGSEIMWIEGTGASERCKVSEDTSRVLVILTDEEVKQI